MIKAPYGFLLTLFSILLLCSPVQARQNSISGGLITSIDFTETKYFDNNIELSSSRNSNKQKLSVGPVFIFNSKSRIDQITARYNPSYTHDIKLNEDNWEHDFHLMANRHFTKAFQCSLSEKFIYSDDPSLIASDNNASYRKDRKRYWTNDVNLATSYAYGRTNTVAAGYYNRILRNDYTEIGGYEDYDRHTADLSLTHHLNPFWNITLGTSYTRGLFAPPSQPVIDNVTEGFEAISPGLTTDTDTTNLSNDLSEYRANVALEHRLSNRKSVQLRYVFSKTEYDAILRNNTNLHNLTIGAEYQYSARLSLALGGGPSYENTETFDPNWNYNAHLNIQYDVDRHSKISANIDKGYDQENFSYNTALGRNQGLTGFWNAKLTFSHALLDNLNALLFISYRDESQENILYGVISAAENDIDFESTDRETIREESAFNRDVYQAGGTLRYTVQQFWTTSLSYTYRNQKSELINDSFDEHRVYLTLAIQKELLRW